MISQQLRPSDAVRFPEHYGIAPIAGLQMTTGGVLIHDAMLVRCNRAEWEETESDYVFKDWHSEYYSTNPVFLLHQYDEPIDSQNVGPFLERLVQDGRRLVTACRLYKTGRLLEPTYTIRFLASGATRYRDVGPFHTEYLAMPADGLTWPLGDDEVGDLSAIYANLTLLMNAPGMEWFDTLIDAFNLPNAPRTKTTFQILLRFIVHEMLFEGVRDELQVGSSSYDRALAVARLLAGNIVDGDFERLFTRDIRPLRNAVVHHSFEGLNVDLGYAAKMLEIIQMVGIRLLMRLCRLEKEPAFAKTRRALGWRKLSPKEMLNACLDRAATDDIEPFREVMSVQS